MATDHGADDERRASVQAEVDTLHRLFGAYIGRVNYLEVMVDGLIADFFAPSSAGRHIRSWLLSPIGLSEKVNMVAKIGADLDIVEVSASPVRRLREAVRIRNEVAHSFVAFDPLDRWSTGDRSTLVHEVETSGLSWVRTNRKEVRETEIRKEFLERALDELDVLNDELRALRHRVLEFSPDA